MLSRKWIIAVALALCGCESTAERDAKFLTRCTNAEFTGKQCAFMLEMAQQSEADISAASTMSGVAIGLSTGALSGVKR